MILLVGLEFCVFLVLLGVALERARAQRVELASELPAEAGAKIEVSGVANRVTT